MAPDKVYATLSESNLKEEPANAEKQRAEEDKPDTNVYKVPVGKSPVLGEKDAIVTIVEFSDFQCPYCKAVEETLKQVRAKYGKDVRLVWKNEPLPFHPRAEPAAELALEARAQKGDVGFWAAHDALFASQPKLADADLESIGRDLKLDVSKVKEAIAKHKYEEVIDDETLLADGLQGGGDAALLHRRTEARRGAAARGLHRDRRRRARQGAGARGEGGRADGDVRRADEGRGRAGPAGEEGHRRPPPADAPTRGPRTAKVEVQEFADFQCPYCRAVEPAIDELVKAYGSKVKLVWRNMPLPETMHPDAELAAEAALEAQAQKGQAGFWKMHDLLFANQEARRWAQAAGARRVRGAARARHDEVGGRARRAHPPGGDRRSIRRRRTRRASAGPRASSSTGTSSRGRSRTRGSGRSSSARWRTTPGSMRPRGSGDIRLGMRAAWGLIGGLVLALTVPREAWAVERQQHLGVSTGGTLMSTSGGGPRSGGTSVFTTRTASRTR